MADEIWVLMKMKADYARVLHDGATKVIHVRGERYKVRLAEAVAMLVAGAAEVDPGNAPLPPGAAALLREAVGEDEAKNPSPALEPQE